MRFGSLSKWLGILGVVSCGVVLAWQWGPAGMARAKPSAPDAFCAVYKDSPLCSSGSVECTMCHTNPPAMNSFGEQLKSVLLPGQKRPLEHDDFVKALPGALKQIETLDADGDGVNNLKEILAGYLPADKHNTPTDLKGSCEPGKGGSCGYDHKYAYKKVYLDFCGESPTYGDLLAFDKEKDKKAKAEIIKKLLTKCLNTNFWVGKEGVVWRLGHDKIRPLQAVKSGVDEGPVPLADYYDDYNLFVYSQIDNRDARELLTGQYFVKRTDGSSTTRYEVRSATEDRRQGQDVAKDKRAGILTSRWTLIFFNMFSVIPRATAAQAYRSYLGMDIARMQGLYSVRNEPADYDNKNVRATGCKGCHQTLDAMSYPFTRYNGLTFNVGRVASYTPERMKRFVNVEGPRIAHVPEAGFILGKRVKNLLEWAKVAANSDEFAKATVMDYWKLLLGSKPAQPKEREEYEKLWKDFKNKYQYSVERMLYALVQTEAYGVP